MIYHLDTVLDFGMHKGETVKTVIDRDPGYIIWAYDEHDEFDLDVEALDYLESDD